MQRTATLAPQRPAHGRRTRWPQGPRLLIAGCAALLLGPAALGADPVVSPRLAAGLAGGPPPPEIGSRPPRAWPADTVRRGHRNPDRLHIQPQLLHRLQTLSGALHKEIVLCLLGRVRADTAFVSDFHMPRPGRSTASAASFSPCPPGTLAMWHNHPPAPPPGIRAPRARPASGAGDLCRLSETDVRTALRSGVPFTVVSVDESRWCSWSLDEVRREARTARTRASQP